MKLSEPIFWWKNGQEILPQRLVWSLCLVIVWLSDPYGSLATMFLPVVAGMMFGSVFQFHRLPEPRDDN